MKFQATALLVVALASLVAAADITTAHVNLYNSSSTVVGSLFFTQVSDNTVTIDTATSSFAWSGSFAVGVYQYADLQWAAPAGAKYNPNGGSLSTCGDTPGNLGNMDLSAAQNLSMNLKGHDSVIGRAFVVFETTTTCPTGDASGLVPLAWGVIGVGFTATDVQLASAYVTSSDEFLTATFHVPSAYTGTVWATGYTQMKWCHSNDTMETWIAVENFTAASTVGWHVHAYGDDSSSTGANLGGHYNPAAQLHALPSEEHIARHQGDLGNVDFGPNGGLWQDRYFNLLHYNNATGNIAGRGTIIHQLIDQGQAQQPTGAAGLRYATAVWSITHNSLSTFAGSLCLDDVTTTALLTTTSTTAATTAATPTTTFLATTSTPGVSPTTVVPTSSSSTIAPSSTSTPAVPTTSDSVSESTTVSVTSEESEAEPVTGSAVATVPSLFALLLAFLLF